MSTPEERAHADAVAQGLKDGLSSEEALEYADAMRGTTWFAWRSLAYAGADAGKTLRESWKRATEEPTKGDA